MAGRSGEHKDQSDASHGGRRTEDGPVTYAFFVKPARDRQHEVDAGVVEEAPELAPGGDLATWLPFLVAWRDARRGDIAAVGHLPGLVQWAEQLTFGEVRGRLTLRPGGIVALALPEGGGLLGACELFWLTSPSLLA